MAGQHSEGQKLTPLQVTALQARWLTPQGQAVIEDMLDDLRQQGESWLIPINHFAASSIAGSNIPMITDAYVADLRGINFDGYDLSGLDLCFMELSHASFKSCILTKTCFQRSDLSFSDFTHSIMPEADLLQIHAHKAVFDHCWLESAMMMASDLTGSSFREANLQSVVMDNSIVIGCSFKSANVHRASFARVIRHEQHSQKRPGPLEPSV
ncbi:pentapeptide repeat-containing protein [Pseudomonas idahonensis]|uniref:pentapeptide repeat-containing protein n=1 Tax=Pseudomonas idahonensis TaxID=2942628 RepID=UPI0030D04EFD